MSAHEAVRAYRGIDGDLWPEGLDGHPGTLSNGLVPLESIDAVNAFIRALRDRHGVDCVYADMSGIEGERPRGLPSSFSFRGWDFGYLEGEYCVFSSILNEVLFGFIPEMRAFGTTLNACLLFSNRRDASTLDAARRRLLASGADLETGGMGAMWPIAIWAAEPIREA